MKRLKFFSTVLAVVGFEVSLLVTTGTTSVLALALSGVYHGGRDDTGWNSDDGVAKNHHNAREEPSDKSNGCDVAIAYGGESDDGPVDAGAYVGELGARLTSLDHIHQCAKNGDKYEDKKKINRYLLEAEPDTLHKEVAFVDEREELKHSEDANETEHTQDEEIARGGQHGDEGEIERQGGEQVDNAEEAQSIFLAAG